MTAGSILALIPARGGSKGLRGKNIRPLAGKPLIGFSIEAARKATRVERILVSTDDPEIARVARSLGADVPFLRPPELAQDDSPDWPVFEHALTWLERHEEDRPEVIVHLRPTAPFRLARHVDESVDLLLAHPEADSVRSVCLAPHTPYKMWRIEQGKLVPLLGSEATELYNLPRQGLPPVYWQNASVDVVRRSTLLEQRSMTGRVILPYVMDERYSVDLDTELDFMAAEAILAFLRDGEHIP